MQVSSSHWPRGSCFHMNFGNPTQNCFVHPNMAAKSTAFPWEFRIAGEVDHHFQHPDTEKDRHPARASPRGVCGILPILRYTSLSTSFHIYFLLVVKLCKRTHPQLVHRQDLHGSPWISMDLHGSPNFSRLRLWLSIPWTRPWSQWVLALS